MRSPVLDPLWITKATSEFDSEYYKYIILSANKRWRDNLNSGDYSNFYEIMFHSLNLNNLAVEGSMCDFKMNRVWDDPKFKEIRKHLRNLYKLPEEIVTIFKNTNFTLTRLIVDYLTQMLDSIGMIKIYFLNPMIHNERDIYMVLSNLNDLQNSVKFLKDFFIENPNTIVYENLITATYTDGYSDNLIIDINNLP